MVYRNPRQVRDTCIKYIRYSIETLKVLVISTVHPQIIQLADLIVYSGARRTLGKYLLGFVFFRKNHLSDSYFAFSDYILITDKRLVKSKKNLIVRAQNLQEHAFCYNCGHNYSHHCHFEKSKCTKLFIVFSYQ